MKYMLNPEPQYRVGDYVKFVLNNEVNEYLGKILDVKWTERDGLHYNIGNYGWVAPKNIVSRLIEEILS